MQRTWRPVRLHKYNVCRKLSRCAMHIVSTHYGGKFYRLPGSFIINLVHLVNSDVAIFLLSTMNFLVVEFPDDKPKTVDVIPQNWLISTSQCYWPSRCQSSNLTKLRRAQGQPDPSLGKCKCRILGSLGKFTFF